MRHRFVLAIIAPLMFVAFSARAEVRDDGGFFSTDAVQRANTATQQMRRDLGKELLIETYPSVPSERAQEFQGSNKDAFFRKWGNERATSAHLDGVYILINKTPAYLFVTEGNKTRQRDFTEADEHELRDAMLSLLKQKQYDEALNKAVEFVPERIRKNQQGSANAGGAVPPSSPGGYSAPPVPSGRTNSPAPAPSPAPTH